MMLSAIGRRRSMLAFAAESAIEAPARGSAPLMQGAKCPECGSLSLIRKDGCDWCTACGYVGVCG